MKNRWLVAFTLGTVLFGGCATQSSERAHGTPLMAGTNGPSRESVAADRCIESYRMRNLRDGAFHRAFLC